MLEILIIRALAGHVGNILRSKGVKPLGYQVLTVLMWFGGEIAGMIAGVLLNLGMGAYLVALGGAGLGAFLAVMIAKQVKAVEDKVDAGVFD